MTDATNPEDASKSLLNRIECLVERQQVRKAVHPTFPLAIYNYTAAVQWRDEWDDTLMKCRGLVLDTDTGEILACPMKKFFNYGDMKHDESTMKMEDCDVMEKLDGSLGILFRYRDEWVFASRGSFVSTHAQMGMKMVKEKGLEGICNGDWTYMFEMIYPTNRIVVDYGTRTELVLIAIVETETSHDFPLVDVLAEGKRIGITLPRIHSSLDTYEALKSKNVKNEEGYIVRSRISGERVKVKFDEYVEIHAIRTRFSL
jgi:RNA ligase